MARGLSNLHIKTNPDQELSIMLVKSRYSRTPKQRACIKALGLSRIRQVVYRKATPEIMGLLNIVGYLLSVTEVSK